MWLILSMIFSRAGSFLGPILKPLLDDWPRTLGITAIVVVLTCPVAYCRGESVQHDKDVAAQQAAQKKADETNAKAIAAEAGERAADLSRIQQTQEEQQHAVQNLPDQGLSARQRARACVVLRQQHVQPLPAGC